MIEDLRKVATKTNDDNLLENLREFESQLDELRRQKQEAEQIAAVEKEKAKEAVRKAREEKEKRQQEETNVKKPKKN